MGLTTDFTVDILPLQLLSVITALNRSLELRDVTSRAWTPEVNYGQYVTNPRDIDHLNNRLGGKRTWSPRRSGSKYRYPSRSCSPHRGETWSDPHSPMVMNRSPSSSFPWGRNPNLELERFCLGCGSLDHILSDRKRTTTIEALRTSVETTRIVTAKTSSSLLNSLWHSSQDLIHNRHLVWITFNKSTRHGATLLFRQISSSRSPYTSRRKQRPSKLTSLRASPRILTADATQFSQITPYDP